MQAPPLSPCDGVADSELPPAPSGSSPRRPKRPHPKVNGTETERLKRPSPQGRSRPKSPFPRGGRLGRGLSKPHPPLPRGPDSPGRGPGPSRPVGGSAGAVREIEQVPARPVAAHEDGYARRLAALGPLPVDVPGRVVPVAQVSPLDMVV